MTDEQIEKTARDHADKHFIQDAQLFYCKPWDKGKDLYAKTLGDFAKYCISHQWISVAERLPEEYRTVLTYIDNDDFRELKIALAHWDGEDWYDIKDSHIRPSHWLPIPQLNPKKQSI